MIITKEITISVYEVVGSRFCTTEDDGQKVYDRISAALSKGISVKLSFNNIHAMIDTFLNAAIGQLYGAFSEEHIRNLLKVEDIDKDDILLIKRVVDNAKEYFKTHRKEWQL